MDHQLSLYLLQNKSVSSLFWFILLYTCQRVTSDYTSHYRCTPALHPCIWVISALISSKVRQVNLGKKP